MGFLCRSFLFFLCCSAPLVTKASFKIISGPDEPGSGQSCNEKYVAFKRDIHGPPFEVVNGTLRLKILNPPPPFRVLFYDEGRPVICATPPPGAGRLFSLPLFVIIYITTSLSIIGSVALLVTYSLFKQLRTLPGQVIMNLAAAFLAGDLLLQIRVAHEHHEIHHLASSALQQHLFLARYVWMCLAGIEMCRSLYNGVTLAYDSKCKRWCLLAVYMAFGWGIPTILATIMVIVEEEGDQDAKKWFGVKGYATNHIPLGITVLINLGVVIFLSVVFWNASQRQKRLQSGFKRRKVNFVRIFLILLTVLGLVWIGFFILLTWSHHVATQIVFVILTLTQPLLVSLAFICTKKVYCMYLQLFGCRKREHSLSSRKGTVSSSLCENKEYGLKRGLTVTSMVSERELNPPVFRRSYVLPAIEEGDEEEDETAEGAGENGGPELNSYTAEVGQTKNGINIHQVKNNRYSPTNSSLSNGFCSEPVTDNLQSNGNCESKLDKESEIELETKPEE